MLLTNCQVLFAGGPHNAFLISLDRLPKKSLVVPVDPKWRDLPQPDLIRPWTGLAAAYVRVGTQIIGGPTDQQLVWRYRFLSYCVPFVSEQDPARAI